MADWRVTARGSLKPEAAINTGGYLAGLTVPQIERFRKAIAPKLAESAPTQSLADLLSEVRAGAEATAERVGRAIGALNRLPLPVDEREVLEDALITALGELAAVDGQAFKVLFRLKRAKPVDG